MTDKIGMDGSGDRTPSQINNENKLEARCRQAFQEAQRTRVQRVGDRGAVHKHLEETESPLSLLILSSHTSHCLFRLKRHWPWAFTRQLEHLHQNLLKGTKVLGGRTGSENAANQESSPGEPKIITQDVQWLIQPFCDSLPPQVPSGACGVQGVPHVH